MLDFLNDMNPLILDSIVVGLLVLIIFFGVIKGIKKTLLDFILLAFSFFLGFSSYMNSVKSVLLTDVFFFDKWLPAGSGNIVIFAMSWFGSFIASLAVFVLLYAVVHVLVILLRIIAKRRFVKEEKRKNKIGRVIGGVFSFAYGGVVVLALLLALNNNIAGVKPLIERSTVTKFIVNKAEELINKKDKDLSKKIVMKVYEGDLLAQIDEDLIKSYNYVNEYVALNLLDKKYVENIEEENFTKEEAEEIVRNRVLDLYHIAVLSNEFDETNKALTDKFVKMAEELIAVMNKKVTAGSLGELNFTLEERGLIKAELKDAGLNDGLLKLLDEIIEGKQN